MKFQIYQISIIRQFWLPYVNIFQHLIMNKFHNTEVLMTRKKILNSCVYSESNIRILSSKWLVYPLNKFSRSPFKGSHIWATFCIFMIPEKNNQEKIDVLSRDRWKQRHWHNNNLLGSNHKNCAKIFENNLSPCNIPNVIFSQYIYCIMTQILRLKYINYNNWM